MPSSSLLAQNLTREEVFGKITPPPGVSNFNAASPSGIGLIVFISNLIRVATIIAGVWVLFNIISAGYLYITNNGESSTHNKVKDSITMSVIGLVIIVGSYTIIALISFFLFGRADFILSPTLQGPTQ